jgi:hypothetical protein
MILYILNLVGNGKIHDPGQNGRRYSLRPSRHYFVHRYSLYLLEFDIKRTVHHDIFLQ